MQYLQALFLFIVGKEEGEEKQTKDFLQAKNQGESWNLIRQPLCILFLTIGFFKKCSQINNLVKN